MTPGNDPMCLDKAGMEWAKAWIGKTPPPAGVGFGYMLMGGSDASNDDPHATKPAAGKKWSIPARTSCSSIPARWPTLPEECRGPAEAVCHVAGDAIPHLMIPIK